MPEVGEIRKGLEIRQGQHYSSFVWQACESCGKERWVRIVKDKAKCKVCKLCTIKAIPNKGSGNGRWKGGKRKNYWGYIDIWLPEDDFFHSMTGKNGYVKEHRLIMAQHLGRCLHSWEIVHHKGTKYPKGSLENRSDNRIENLQLVTDDRHKQITILERRVTYLEKRVTLLEAENILLRKEKDALLS